MVSSHAGDDDECGTPLAGERLGYQSITLPDGSVTSGYDRSYLNDAIFGGEFAGKSLLDIGSYLGYFCIEAMKRGGSSALGIEADPVSVRQSRLLAKIQGVGPDYQCADFESWDSGSRTFDTVICLNVLHHMIDAVGAIQTMMALARHRIVLEFEGPPAPSGLAAKVASALRGNPPAIFLGAPRKSHDAMKRTFLFTPESMTTLFNGWTRLFEPVAISSSPFKGRYILQANKRSIGHLVVVAGPTASGKSTLVEKLERDPGERSKLGFSGEHWHVPRADEDDLPRGRLDNVLLHYDLLRPYRRSTGTHARDPWTDFMSVADEITVITLMPPRSVLRERLARADRDVGKADSKRHRDLRERYTEPGFLEDWYDAWFRFCAGFPSVARNLIVTTTDDGENVLPATGWKETFARIY